MKYLNDEQDNWDDFIDPVLLVYRRSVHKTTKKTPYFLAFGKEPTLLIEEQFPVNGSSEGASDEDLDAALTRRVESTLKLFNCHTEAKTTSRKCNLPTRSSMMHNSSTMLQSWRQDSAQQCSA